MILLLCHWLKGTHSYNVHLCFFCPSSDRYIEAISNIGTRWNRWKCFEKEKKMESVFIYWFVYSHATRQYNLQWVSLYTEKSIVYASALFMCKNHIYTPHLLSTLSCKNWWRCSISQSYAIEVRVYGVYRNSSSCILIIYGQQSGLWCYAVHRFEICVALHARYMTTLLCAIF